MRALRKKRVGSAVFDPEMNKWFVKGLDTQHLNEFMRIYPEAEDFGKHGYGFTATVKNVAYLLWVTKVIPLSMSRGDRQIMMVNAETYRDQESIEIKLGKNNTQRDIEDWYRADFDFGWWQHEALNFVEYTRNAVILYDICMGKTLIALSIASIDNNGPLVLVVEPHLAQQMKEDAEEVTAFNVHLVEGTTPYDLPEDANIYIFKYTQLKGWQEYLSTGWVGAIVFDEVQRLRGGEKTNQASAADAICDHVPTVVGLTATLIYNRGIEIFNLSKIFNNNIFGTKAEFIDEWCDGDVNGIVSDPKLLGEYLQRKGFVHRRTREDIGFVSKLLPPSIEFVQSDGAECPELINKAKALAEKLMTNSGETGATSPMALFRMAMYQVTGIAKARSVARDVKRRIESGKSVLLFGYHSEVFDIWMSELSEYEPAIITGKNSDASVRAEQKNRFVSGETPILLLNYMMGAGLNGLDKNCHTVVFGELPWVSATVIQCCGRLDRMLQKHEINVSMLISAFGIDRRILEFLDVKRHQREGIERENVLDGDYRTIEAKAHEASLKGDPSEGYNVDQTIEMAEELLSGALTVPITDNVSSPQKEMTIKQLELQIDGGGI